MQCWEVNDHHSPSLPQPADKPLFFRAAQFNKSEHFSSPEKYRLELFLLAPSRWGWRNDHTDGNTGLALAATHSRHQGEDRDGDRHWQPGTAWAKGCPVRNGILVTSITTSQPCWGWMGRGRLGGWCLLRMIFGTKWRIYKTYLTRSSCGRVCLNLDKRRTRWDLIPLCKSLKGDCGSWGMLFSPAPAGRGLEENSLKLR